MVSSVFCICATTSSFERTLLCCSHTLELLKNTQSVSMSNMKFDKCSRTAVSPNRSPILSLILLAPHDRWSALSLQIFTSFTTGQNCSGCLLRFPYFLKKYSSSGRPIAPILGFLNLNCYYRRKQYVLVTFFDLYIFFFNIDRLWIISREYSLYFK